MIKVSNPLKINDFETKTAYLAQINDTYLFKADRFDFSPRSVAIIYPDKYKDVNCAKHILFAYSEAYGEKYEYPSNSSYYQTNVIWDGNNLKCYIDGNL